MNLNEFMEEAFIEARLALVNNEVPVGCVFVYDNKIMARSGNQVNATKNATRHAEMVCIDQVIDYCAAQQLDSSKIFPEIIAVVTVEPCIMCFSALHNLRVKQVMYGCTNDRFGGKTVFDVSQIMDHTVSISGGLRADEAMNLLKKFYEGENPSAPIPKNRKAE